MFTTYAPSPAPAPTSESFNIRVDSATRGVLLDIFRQARSAGLEFTAVETSYVMGSGYRVEATPQMVARLRNFLALRLPN